MLGSTRIIFRDYVSLRLSFSDGTQGFATGFERGMPLFEIVSGVAPYYLGCPSDLRIKSLHSALTPAPASRPVYMRGISLFDIASWDAFSKQISKPLWAVFGGVRDRIPVMPVIGYGATPELIATQCRDLSQQGFKHVKLMIGGLDKATDIKLLKAMRDNLQEDCSYGIDAHWSWRTIDDALPTCLAAEEYGASFIEDPFAPTQWRSLKQLQNKLRTSIAVGEDVIDRFGFLDLADSALILRPDATASGGIFGMLDVISLAHTLDKNIIPHVFPYLHAHFGFSSTTVKMVESILPDVGADPIDQFFTDLGIIKDGMLHTSDHPGASTTLNWDKLTEFSTRSEILQ